MSYAVTPEDYAVLVRESRARGLDPRDAALVLYMESGGFNPASAGPGGKGGANGLNQLTPENLAKLGFTPEAWRALSAAEQLPRVFAWWDGIAHDFRPEGFPDNAGDLLALNFLPGRYKAHGAAKDPDAPLTQSPEAPFYTKNTFYDPGGTGAITVNTIRARQALEAKGARWNELVTGISAAGDAPSSLTPAAPPAPPAPRSRAGGSAFAVGFLLTLVAGATWLATRGA
jgi:hypothetical protein